MYSVGGATMIFGVLLGIGLVVFMIWYFNKQIDNKLKDKQWLTRFAALSLIALLGLFIVDKIIAFRIHLLTDEMSNGLFELIKNIVLVAFGYQFGGKSDSNSKDDEK
jgi:hypothetical protein